jgi:hypothetical protein
MDYELDDLPLCYHSCQTSLDFIDNFVFPTSVARFEPLLLGLLVEWSTTVLLSLPNKPQIN